MIDGSSKACHLEMQARFAAGSMTEAEMADLTEIADTLGADGHSLAYLRARLLLGRAALSFGRLSEAETVLQTVAVARDHRQVRMRTQAWLAETLLRQARGDRAGALRSAGAGLRAGALARSLVGTADIGVLVAGHGVELGRIGLRLALEGGRPPTVLRWMELTPATALQFPRSDPSTTVIWLPSSPSSGLRIGIWCAPGVRVRTPGPSGSGWLRSARR